MSQQEEARRALDLEAIRARVQADIDIVGMADELVEERRDRADLLAEVEDLLSREAALKHAIDDLRALTATAPQTQPEPVAWMVESKYDPTFFETRREDVNKLHGELTVTPLYRGAAPQVQETESR